MLNWLRARAGGMGSGKAGGVERGSARFQAGGPGQGAASGLVRCRRRCRGAGRGAFLTCPCTRCRPSYQCTAGGAGRAVRRVMGEAQRKGVGARPRPHAGLRGRLLPRPLPAPRCARTRSFRSLPLLAARLAARLYSISSRTVRFGLAASRVWAYQSLPYATPRGCCCCCCCCCWALPAAEDFFACTATLRRRAARVGAPGGAAVARGRDGAVGRRGARGAPGARPAPPRPLPRSIAPRAAARHW
jgi:hypothetical protein